MTHLHSPNRRTASIRLILGSLAAFHGICAAVALAQGTRAGVVTTLEGDAELARAAAVRPLRFDDELFGRDNIDTRERSLVRVLLGGKAVVTVRELSSLTIGEEPAHATVNLKEGTVALGVAKRLLQPGEAVEVRTPNAIAAVRGSYIVVEIHDVHGVPQTRIVTRDVSLPVEIRAGGHVTQLDTNHVVLVSGAGAHVSMTPPRLLNASEIAAADAAGHAPRATKHSEKVPDSLDLSHEGEHAKHELDRLSDGEHGRHGHDDSTSSIGLNESNAAQAGFKPPSEPPTSSNEPPVVSVLPQAAPPPQVLQAETVPNEPPPVHAPPPPHGQPPPPPPPPHGQPPPHQHSAP